MCIATFWYFSKGKARIKTNSVQLIMKLGLSLAKNQTKEIKQEMLKMLSKFNSIPVPLLPLFKKVDSNIFSNQL